MSELNCASAFGVYQVPGSRPGTAYMVKFYGTTSDATCECQGFKFSKTCKHIAQVYTEACMWHETDDPGIVPELTPLSFTKTPMEGKSCPVCGGPVVDLVTL